MAHKRVLVIDDDVTIQEDFRRIIGTPDPEAIALRHAESILFGGEQDREETWFDVETASRGEDGYHKVKQACRDGKPYALAFVDMLLPMGWGALQTIRRIWAMDPDIQVVLCTEHSDQAWGEIQKLLHAQDRLLILKKPFAPVEVLQLANTLTEKWRQLQASRNPPAKDDALMDPPSLPREDSQRSLPRLLEEAVRQREEALRACEKLKAELEACCRRENQLREKALLLDQTRDAIIVRDPQHRITFWNKSAERLYGWTAEEMMNRSPAEFLYESPEDFHAACATLLEQDEWTGELRQKSREGRSMIIRAHWTLMRDAQGQPQSTFAIDTDITEQKELELQFLRSQRMESLGSLAGGIAHDLNNALTPITMATDFLRPQLEADEQSLQVLDTIAQSARRGADIVGQVLSFARGMKGRRIPVYPTEVMKEVTEMCRETFPKNIDIHCQISGDLWSIQGDPTQIHQVLLNLCVNARDAMPHGGCLRVGACNVHYDPRQIAAHPSLPRGPHVMVIVEDSGTGMPPEVMQKIFDPFFTTKDQGKGTGLGLSTTQNIVKNHGGLIFVDSIPGRGTQFRICFPADRSIQAGSPAPQNADLPKGNGETILVVDDEVCVRQLALQTLESYGYRVILACNGSEAVNLYAHHRNRIAAVITDVMMPVMDGQTTVRTLRNLNPSVRLIVASGCAAEHHQGQPDLAQVKHFLQKPFRTHSLLHALHELLMPQA